MAKARPPIPPPAMAMVKGLVAEEEGVDGVAILGERRANLREYFGSDDLGKMKGRAGQLS